MGRGRGEEASYITNKVINDVTISNGSGQHVVNVVGQITKGEEVPS